MEEPSVERKRQRPTEGSIHLPPQQRPTSETPYQAGSHWESEAQPGEESVSGNAGAAKRISTEEEEPSVRGTIEAAKLFRDYLAGAGGTEGYRFFTSRREATTVGVFLPTGREGTDALNASLIYMVAYYAGNCDWAIWSDGEDVHLVFSARHGKTFAQDDGQPDCAV